MVDYCVHKTSDIKVIYCMWSNRKALNEKGLLSINEIN